MELEIKELELNKNIVIIDDTEIMELIDGFKYTKKDLTADGVLTTDAQFRHIQELEDKNTILKLERMVLDDNKRLLDLKMRVKCIGLNAIGKHIMTDTRKLTKRDRDNLQSEMRKMESKTIEEIINKFNNICCDDIFDTGYDYSNLPVYDI